MAAYTDVASARGASAVDISSTDATLKNCRGLYIGVTGDVIVDMVGSGTSITFKAAPVGVLPIQPSKVYKTGTTATNILALY